ncbi:hypothetical protein HNP99_001042 [Flavobacterium sp. 28A]|uniref:hypothetical protein n=1 Tax=Flavobacterium sp. 28A TaxID=2735895 RepID=UPI00156F1B92|nr:hypothetical protein [Flavobacterium sp. 28A]NRT14698.1 hypothetical protein [Flavobacterium sp. 28A]
MNDFFKILTICSITLMTTKSNAQEKFTTYDNTYGEKTYEIQISSKDKEKFSLYIDAMSLDSNHSKGGITIDQKQHQDFLNAIAEAKIKYEEWVNTAKENDVKELDKTMTIKSKAGAYFLYGNKWNFQNFVNLKYDFKIIESKGEIKYLLLLKTGKLQSSSNQFMKVDGFVFVFSSTKEVDDFTNAISSEKITEFMNKPKKEALFKD